MNREQAVDIVKLWISKTTLTEFDRQNGVVKSMKDAVDALLEAFPDAKGATDSAETPASEAGPAEWAMKAVNDALWPISPTTSIHFPLIARLVERTRERAIEECAKAVPHIVGNEPMTRLIRDAILALKSRPPS